MDKAQLEAIIQAMFGGRPNPGPPNAMQAMGIGNGIETRPGRGPMDNIARRNAYDVAFNLIDQQPEVPQGTPLSMAPSGERLFQGLQRNEAYSPIPMFGFRTDVEPLRDLGSASVRSLGGLPSTRPTQAETFQPESNFADNQLSTVISGLLSGKVKRPDANAPWWR